MSGMDLYTRLQRNSGVTMGKLYYAGLRKDYQPDDRIQTQLVPKNENDVPGEDLDRALIAFRKHPPQLCASRPFFEGDRLPNQLSSVLVCRFLSDIPSASGFKQVPLVMSGFRWI